MLVVQGDWNTKVGEDAQEDWGEVCGPFCNPETNGRGLKLQDFATYNNLVLANTLGNHKPSRRWTWHSPDGTHHNQIDYCIIPKFSDTQNICCNHPKIWTRWLYWKVMHPKDAAGIANSVDPDQTAPLGLFAQTCLSENLGSLRYIMVK